MATTVGDNAGAQRFEVTVDGELAGFTEYVQRANAREFPHTLIEPRFRNRGLGATLIHAALDATKSAHMEVLPSCWFVRDYIAEHPDEYLALVPSAERARFGLDMPGSQP
ncbi:MAG: GNAT family N-acetyltransferase [Ilumatobacteraceae bacterium]